MDMVENTAKTQNDTLFTPAQVSAVFDATWLDEATCRFWVIHWFHHNGARCPGCGARITDAQRVSFFLMKRVKCAACDRFFNALSGTFLSGTKLSFRQVVLMNLLLGENVSDQRIGGYLKVDRSTVRAYRLRIHALDQLNRSIES